MPRKKVEGSEELIGVSEVLERFDPDVDVEADSDPTFEFKVDVPEADKHLGWIHDGDIPLYTGKRYAPVRGGEVELKSGETFPEGEVIKKAGHTLMACDRAYHEKRQVAERRANTQLRERMTKSAMKTVFVNTPGTGR